MQDNYNNRKVSLMNLNTPLNSSGGSPMAFSVFHDAFAIYGVHDYLGTGGNVVRMFVYSASPQERDFTADELTDGTFSSWAGSSAGYAKVAKIYNQTGDSDLDLSSPTTSNYHFYDNTNNEIRPDQAGYYSYTNLYTQASGASAKIASAFEDNTTTSDTTFVMGARKKDNGLYGLPASNRTLTALRDTTSPVQAYQAKHKAIRIANATYSDDIGISAKGDDFVEVKFFHDTFDHSTCKTYIGEIERQPVSGVTSTDMNFFVNGTQEVDENVTTLDNDIQIGRFEIGDNRYRFKCIALFNKILTTAEKSAIHTRLSEDY
jgi:hypothetical protein